MIGYLNDLLNNSPKGVKIEYVLGKAPNEPIVSRLRAADGAGIIVEGTGGTGAIPWHSVVMLTLLPNA